MQEKYSQKKGFTLIEMLVVITIIGILSALGVSGLQQGIKNNRIKDAAINTSAFLNRVANEASRRDTVLCIKKSNDQKIEVYTGSECSSGGGTLIDSLLIESPTKFVSGNACSSVNSKNLLDESNANLMVFKPKLGLSALPTEGVICIQYGTSSIYSAVEKNLNANFLTPQWSVDGSSWTKI